MKKQFRIVRTDKAGNVSPEGSAVYDTQREADIALKELSDSADLADGEALVTQPFWLEP